MGCTPDSLYLNSLRLVRHLVCPSHRSGRFCGRSRATSLGKPFSFCAGRRARAPGAKPGGVLAAAVSSWKQMVGERGFEPPTPWSRTRCSTRLSHSPTTPTFSSIWPLARLGWSLSTPSVYHPAAGLPAGGTPAKPSVRAPLFVHKQCRTASALMLAHVAVRAQIAHSRTRLLRRQNLPHRESKG